MQLLPDPISFVFLGPLVWHCAWPFVPLPGQPFPLQASVACSFSDLNFILGEFRSEGSRTNARVTYKCSQNGLHDP